jgi:predicted transcriptional regulator
MYRVIEVAKMLGVSKVTVYKKINKNKKQLKNHIQTRSNITYIDDIGIEIIKNTIEVTSTYSASDPSDIGIVQKEVIDDLNEIIVFLSDQVIEKKSQIEKKDEILDSYKTIIKSNRGKIQYLESKISE